MTEDKNMAILEVLSRSKRLCEERSVIILMYPPHLKENVKPGQKITIYHGSQERHLNTLLPVNDYAVRHGFSKGPNSKLKPLLFFATNPITAAAYALPETLLTKLRGMPRERRQRFIGEINASFGSVYGKELQLPHRFGRKPFLVERIESKKLNQIIVVTNRAISPDKNLMSLGEVCLEDPGRKMLIQAIQKALGSTSSQGRDDRTNSVWNF